MGDRLAGKTRREIKRVLKLNAPKTCLLLERLAPNLGM
jgi:hypothetical protein